MTQTKKYGLDRGPWGRELGSGARAAGPWALRWTAGRLLAKPNNNVYRQIEPNITAEGLLKLPEQSVQVPTKVKHTLTEDVNAVRVGTPSGTPQPYSCSHVCPAPQLSFVEPVDLTSFHTMIQA